MIKFLFVIISNRFFLLKNCILFNFLKFTLYILNTIYSLVISDELITYKIIIIYAMSRRYGLKSGKIRVL